MILNIVNFDGTIFTEMLFQLVTGEGTGILTPWCHSAFSAKGMGPAGGLESQT